MLRWTDESRARHKSIAKTKRYRSDLTDEEWSAVHPFLPAPAGVGSPRRVDTREVLNAIRYLVPTGCAWSMLPIHFPPWQTVYWWFRRLARRMMFRTIHDVALMIDRALANRDIEPTAAIIDGQTVKALAPGARRGYDGAKKTVGRKRHIAVDTAGRVPLVHLTSANIADSAYDRRQLLDKQPFSTSRSTSSNGPNRHSSFSRGVGLSSEPPGMDDPTSPAHSGL